MSGISRVCRMWSLLLVLGASFIPAVSLAESLFLSAYGIYQCNLDGSELRLLRRLHPHTLLWEVAANSRTGAVYWLEVSTIYGTFMAPLDFL